jgi:hypothetical protein
LGYFEIKLGKRKEQDSLIMLFLSLVIKKILPKPFKIIFNKLKTGSGLK